VPLQARLELSLAQVAQGNVFVARVEANHPSAVSGLLTGGDGDHPVRFVLHAEGDYVALVGIGAIDDVGKRTLGVTVRSQDGQEQRLVAEIEVIEGTYEQYEQEDLQFAPSVARLLSPELSQPELQLLGDIYGGQTAKIFWREPFAWPAEGAITSAFGTRRRYQGGGLSYHAGIDIDGETGDDIRAPAAGVVVLARPLNVRGNAVIIDHGAGVYSGLYHLDHIGVDIGQFVQGGDIIGRMGATGLVTGSHLHWEMRVGGVAVEPRAWIGKLLP